MTDQDPSSSLFPAGDYYAQNEETIVEVDRQISTAITSSELALHGVRRGWRAKSQPLHPDITPEDN